VIGIVVVSVMPMVIEFLKATYRARKAGQFR
jgi:hypothetical protein